MIFQKKYWSSGEYSDQQNVAYQGYVGIYNGCAYAFGTKQLLKKKSNQYTDFNCSSFHFDRILDQKLKLPYSKKQCSLQANDFLNKSVIKNILKKIHLNNNYLYKCSTISNTKIPNSKNIGILAPDGVPKFVDKDNITHEQCTNDNKGKIQFERNPKCNERYNLVVGALPRANYPNNFWQVPQVKPDQDDENKLKFVSIKQAAPYYESCTTSNIDDIKFIQNANCKEKLTLKVGDKPQVQYPQNYYNIPKTTVEIKRGKLKMYPFQKMRETKTATDSTFYDQYQSFFSHAWFVGKNSEDKYTRHSKYIAKSNSNQIKKAFIDNPNFNSQLEPIPYTLKQGQLPKESYQQKHKKIPATRVIRNYDVGDKFENNTKDYPDVAAAGYKQINYKKRTDKTEPYIRSAFIVNPNRSITADETYWDQNKKDEKYSDVPLKSYDSKYYKVPDVYHKVTPADYPLNQIRAAESVVTKVQKENGTTKATVLLFLAFPQKLVIMRMVYYPNDVDFQKNTSTESEIFFDFNNENENDKNILILQQIDSVNKNSLKFLSIRDVRIHKNQLYLTDQKLNMVLRYDIQKLIGDQQDFSLSSLRLLDVLQGDGNLNDKLFFNRPFSICANDDFIYVCDRGNYCIKKYHRNFQYISTIRVSYGVAKQTQTISINPHPLIINGQTIAPSNSLWIFSTSTNYLYINVYDGEKIVYTKMIEKIELLKDKFMWDQQFKSVKFSFTNSNYYYICTTKRVYKLHVSNPTYPFASLGYFDLDTSITTMVWSKVFRKWHLLPTGKNGVNVTWNYRPAISSAQILDNKAFCLCGHEQFQGDIIIHIGNLYNQAKLDTYCKRNACTFKDIPTPQLAAAIICSGFFIYTQRDSYITSLTNVDYDSFLTQQIEKIEYQQYINALTFNKLIYKIMANLVALKNHLIGRFWGAYNIDNLMTFDQLQYEDYFQNLKIKNNHDYFIHQNQPVSMVVNRIFENVYNLQQKILKKMEAKYRAQGTFTNNSIKLI